jgi:hypothetical protein
MLANTPLRLLTNRPVLTSFGDQTLACGWLAVHGMPAMS